MSMNDFQLIDAIGKGTYSSVYKVLRLIDGHEYALKKVAITSLSAKERDNALNEIRILASIKSQNVVKYKEAFIDKSTDSLWYFII